MQTITTIGLDVAKTVFQVNGVDAAGNIAIRRQLKSRYVLLFFEKLPPCLAGIEACASAHHWSRELQKHGQQLRRYWTNACRDCALKPRCTSGKERRITRWEHEHVLEAVQQRLDRNPQAMRQRRETVEHPFGTLKMRMGATHFLMKRLPKVASEMALHVLAYNLTRVMNIMGAQPLMAAIRAWASRENSAHCYCCQS